MVLNDLQLISPGFGLTGTKFWLCTYRFVIHGARDMPKNKNRVYNQIVSPGTVDAIFHDEGRGFSLRESIELLNTHSIRS
jgi:hypothetical protein